MATPNRSMKTIALLAALTALMGVVATGCGTEDDAKDTDKTEQPADDEATDGEDAAGDEAAEDATDGGDEAAEDEVAPADEDA